MSFALLEQILGGVLVLFVVADVFLTVLYARIGTGIIHTNRINTRITGPQNESGLAAMLLSVWRSARR